VHVGFKLDANKNLIDNHRLASYYRLASSDPNVACPSLLHPVKVA
jgi:hypothetical protein